MRMARKKILTGVLCAAALTLTAWAGGIDAGEYPPPPAQAATVTETALPEAESVPDNDALFYGYLLRRAGVTDSAELMASAGSSLNAKDKELYDLLKTFVTEIAEGKRTNTVYVITYDDFPKTLTAAELGVTDCFSDEGKAAIKARIDALYDYDTNAVFDALLSDCPYELYWYDKSSNGGVGFHYAGSAYSGTRSQVTFKSVPSFTVTMTVAQDYGLRTGGGYYNPNEVDRSLHDGIENVVTNAKAIVSAYQGKSDYEKLLGYSKEICDLVEYDDYAADNDDTPYGDPWQLINVFDENPATNVVCEGYSKAFKYLCDLSKFNSPKVECYLVTGTLGGGTGAGAHMWNIVTMENGKNYLVDVTNSDSNGGPEYLLLKGGTPAAEKYTFYNHFVFTYDSDTFNLWGNELLTLDTMDYQDAEHTEPVDDPEPVEIHAQIRGCSLTLVDDIALNFYLTFDDEVTADSGAYVRLSGAQAADTKTFLISEAFSGTVDGVDGTVYRFTAHMPAKRMNDKITLACYDGQNQPYGMSSPSGASVTEFAYCVRDYLNRAASETTLQTLAEAMSAYGYYAQRQFGYDTASAVAPSSSVASKVAAVSAETLSDYAPVDSGAVSGISVVGDNLTLDSAITQRFIFDADGALSNYSFLLDGQAVTPKAYNSSYCVEIPDITAKDLDKTHTLTIRKGAETFTHQCSALSYACKALTDSSASTDLQNLVKSMYLYHAEAKAYFNA